MRWIHRQKKDPFIKKRNELGVLSRSYFKIEEICKTFSILRPHGRVLDLGCSPGGWTQFLTAQNQYVIGVDLLPIKCKINEFYQQDICDFVLSGSKVHTIVSDIAVNVSGHKHLDDSNMCGVVEAVGDLIKLNLSIGGNAVMKVFSGTSLKLALSLIAPMFKRHKIFKPLSSRSESCETYFVGLQFIGQ